MAKNTDRYFLGLAGEYAVCADLAKRKNGVDNVLLEQILDFENNWESLMHKI